MDLTSLIVLGACSVGSSIRIQSVALKVLPFELYLFLDVALVRQEWERATLLLLNLPSLKIVAAVEILDQLFLLLYQLLFLKFKPGGGTLPAVRGFLRLVYVVFWDPSLPFTDELRWYSQRVGDLALLLVNVLHISLDLPEIPTLLDFFDYRYRVERDAGQVLRIRPFILARRWWTSRNFRILWPQSIPSRHKIVCNSMRLQRSPPHTLYLRKIDAGFPHLLVGSDRHS